MNNEEIKYGQSKFKNIGGVTCYINSILTILQNCPIFSDYIVTGQFSKIIIENNKNDPIKLLDYISYQFYQIIKGSLENDDYKITPTSFKKTMGKKNPMWNNNQQDSQEFFSFLITCLEEEICDKVIFIPGKNINKNNVIDTKLSILRINAQKSWEKYIKNEFSPLKLMFTGMEYSKQECEFCKSISNSFQIFKTLQLSIPIENDKNYYTKTQENFDLDECLDLLIDDETLEYGNRLNCSLCGRKNKAKKTISIYKPPKILVIHIKRFIRNNYGILTRKLTNHIKYPIIDFDISDYISNESPFKHHNKYNLFAVNKHYELGSYGNINAGHYTSIVKSKFDNKWYEFNDSLDIRYIDNHDEIVSKNAYLLFYYRTN
jgi:ubiquitin carboxyl-terminal hydrolase 8